MTRSKRIGALLRQGIPFGEAVRRVDQGGKTRTVYRRDHDERPHRNPKGDGLFWLIAAGAGLWWWSRRQNSSSGSGAQDCNGRPQITYQACWEKYCNQGRPASGMVFPQTMGPDGPDACGGQPSAGSRF